MLWTQLRGEREGKGQQNQQGQELRWLLTRQSSQPRKSKQVLNVLKCFYIRRHRRVRGIPNPAGHGQPLVEEGGWAWATLPTSPPRDSAFGISLERNYLSIPSLTDFSENEISGQKKIVRS